MIKAILISIFILLPLTALGAIKTQIIAYEDKDVSLEGYLAYDQNIKGTRPGVVVVHEWKGRNEYAERRARQLAELGYVAFALDMYGKGIIAKNTQEAAKFSSRYKKDRALMRRRAQAGLKTLLKQPQVDPDRIAAIGYCFGGTVVLELARSGADIDGVVSFHGNLDTPRPKDASDIKAQVLVLHGADDPYVPIEEVNAFTDEMKKGDVRWELIMYGNAVHAFTNPANGTDNSKGAAYNETADKRSWQAMQNFFSEIFQ
jgi:dienelactone hydrolase